VGGDGLAQNGERDEVLYGRDVLQLSGERADAAELTRRRRKRVLALRHLARDTGHELLGVRDEIVERGGRGIATEYRIGRFRAERAHEHREHETYENVPEVGHEVSRRIQGDRDRATDMSHSLTSRLVLRSA